MTIQYLYTVQKLNTIDFDAYPMSVVYAVATITASNGTQSATVGFAEQLTYDFSKPFIPYKDLTESQVIQWMKDAAGSEKIATLEEKAAHLLTTSEPFFSPELPWKATK